MPTTSNNSTTARRTFLKQTMGFGAVAASSVLSAQAETVSVSTDSQRSAEPVAPPALRPGGTIAVLAPSSPAGDKAEQAAAWLRTRGFVPRILASARTSGDYLAGADELRLHDLHQAFAATDVDAIICLRGGYGSMRFLDEIDFSLIARNPKPFVGYSDVTALLLAITRYTGLVTFHGPMLASDLMLDKRPPTESDLFDTLQGRRVSGQSLTQPPRYPLETIVAGSVSGRLIGGNLATIGATLGTPFEIDLDGAILFIEDVGETPQKIDRLLTQLRLAGKLAQVKGILIGDFSEINDPRASSDNPVADRRRLRKVWHDLLEPLAVPILAGWKSGHCDPNLTLPIGALVELDASTQRLRLEQNVVRS
ncbi:MAG: LD-carboxypeptidase [Herbaspirillum sp.]